MYITLSFTPTDKETAVSTETPPKLHHNSQFMNETAIDPGQKTVQYINFNSRTRSNGAKKLLIILPVLHSELVAA